MGGSGQSKQRTADNTATRTGPKGYENVKRVKRVENAGGVSLITERPIADGGDVPDYQPASGRPASIVIESSFPSSFDVSTSPTAATAVSETAATNGGVTSFASQNGSVQRAKEDEFMPLISNKHIPALKDLLELWPEFEELLNTQVKKRPIDDNEMVGRLLVRILEMAADNKALAKDKSRMEFAYEKLRAESEAIEAALRREEAENRRLNDQLQSIRRGGYPEKPYYADGDAESRTGEGGRGSRQSTSPAPYASGRPVSQLPRDGDYSTFASLERKRPTSPVQVYTSSAPYEDRQLSPRAVSPISQLSPRGQSQYDRKTSEAIYEDIVDMRKRNGSFSDSIGGVVMRQRPDDRQARGAESAYARRSDVIRDDLPEEEREQVRKRETKSKIYVAMPLLKAQGAAQSKDILRQRASLRPGSGLYPEEAAAQRLAYSQPIQEDAGEAVDNSYVSPRVLTASADRQIQQLMPVASSRPSASKDKDEAVLQYRELGHRAVTEIQGDLIKVIGDTTTIQIFICSVMMISHESVREQIKVARNKLRQVSPSDDDGQLTMKLQTMTESAYIQAAMQAAEYRLSLVHRDCMTPGMTSYPAFQRYLRNACYVAWKLQLTTPPLQPVADTGLVYNPVNHILHYGGDAPPPATPIAYYTWPVLVEAASRAVLIRGRVVLSQSERM